MVALALAERDLRAVVVERRLEPFAGRWALPGGLVGEDEDLDVAAGRVLQAHTGVPAAAHLEQLGAYARPDRDPRARIVSIAYLAVLRDLGNLTDDGGADAVELVPVAKLLRRRGPTPLAFDHGQILGDGVERARNQLESTNLAAAFVGPTFTLSELRGVYEAAWSTRLDPGNFRRKVLSTEGFAVPTGRVAVPGPEGGKPAQVYRAGTNRRLHPPIMRPPADRSRPT